MPTIVSHSLFGFCHRLRTSFPTSQFEVAGQLQRGQFRQVAMVMHRIARIRLIESSSATDFLT